jgi:hypothetical protein
MFLKNEGKDNELCLPPTMYPLLKKQIDKRTILQKSTKTMFCDDYSFESNR